MKATILSVAASLALCLPCLGGTKSVLLDSPAPAGTGSLWDISIYSTFEQPDSGLSLFGYRAEAGTHLTRDIDVGAFYGQAWVDGKAGKPLHKSGLYGRYFPFETFPAYAGLDVGAVSQGGEHAPFAAAWVGLQLNLDAVTAGLRADLGVGYSGHWTGEYLDSFGARVGLSYSF